MHPANTLILLVHESNVGQALIRANHALRKAERQGNVKAEGDALANCLAIAHAHDVALDALELAKFGTTYPKGGYPMPAPTDGGDVVARF